MIDATAGGALISKTPEVVYEPLEELSSNNYQWSFERARPKPMARVLELHHMSNFASQLATLNKKLDKFEKMNVNSVQTNIVCRNCAGKHNMVECFFGGTSNFDRLVYMGNYNW